MRSVIAFLSLMMVLCTMSGEIRVLQSGCQLCMNTYKTNCTICYDVCNDNRTLNQCTNYKCTQKNADQQCTQWDTVTLNSTNCLGTCCNGLMDSATPFT